MKLTCILCNVQQRELRRCAHGIRQSDDAIGALPQLRRVVRHEVPRQEEGARNPAILDVPLNLRLPIEMGDVFQFAAARLSHVQQAGEDEMLNAELF